MNQSAITVRYAKAFFSLAKEKNLLETLKKDMELVEETCRISIDFILLLESPVVKTSKKKSVMASVFSEKINAYTLQFLNLVLENKRDVHLQGICRNFLDLVRKDQNIKSALITTASEINKNTLTKIKELIEKKLNTKVELSENIKPEIIGGLVLRIDDK